MKERSLPLPGGCWKLQSIRLHQEREAPMETAYDGRQVVGMDLHRRRSVLVRMTEDGRRLGTAKITNSPAELRREIARAGKAPKVVLEATYGWYWAADTLVAAGAEVHLAHPLGVKAFTYRRVKNDERDSADLADLLRMGRLPEAWIAPHHVRDDPRLRQATHAQQVSEVSAVSLVVLDPPVAERPDPQRVRQVHLSSRRGEGVRGPVPPVCCLEH